ncbi:hypothetical protein TNCV_2624191 [Trichonephila clavipes]|nr:hypothetical protein TNCV_2624191 [Trichonephila clavipes]
MITYSPALNPMDYSVWSVLEYKVCTKPHKTLDSLKQSLLREWGKLKVVDDVPTQVEEDRSQTIGSTSVRLIAASVDQPRSMVHKILRKVSRNYPYKLSLLQQIPGDLDSR